MVLNYHIQINIYGDSLIKIVENNICLSTVLKNAGIAEFVIVEIPHHQFKAPIKEETLEIIEKDWPKDLENEEEKESLLFNESLMPYTANWYCSTPIRLPEPEIGSQYNATRDQFTLNDSWTDFNCSFGLYKEVSGIVEDMIACIENGYVSEQNGNNILENCSLFTTSANLSTGNNNELSVANEKNVEKIEVENEVDQIDNDVDLNSSFRSCVSPGGEEVLPDLKTTSSADPDLPIKTEKGKSRSSRKRGCENGDDSKNDSQIVVCQFPLCRKPLKLINSRGISGLKEHCRQHTNEIVRKCEHCKCSFRTLYQLKRHHGYHHENVPFRVPPTSPADTLILQRILRISFPTLIIPKNPQNLSADSFELNGRIKKKYYPPREKKK